jgi:hypothetical protein
MQSNEDTEIARIEERFPDWEIHRVFGGWEAVPRGTEVIRAVSLGSLAEKLATAERLLTQP